jgi:uncharacterized damage-inducible protein DinB
MSEKLEEGVSGHSALRELWEHHWWSFEQFLDEAGTLSDEEFRRDLRLSYRSIHGALAHAVGSEQVWLKRVTQRQSMARVPGTEELQTFQAIEEAWEECKGGWQQTLREDDLERVIDYQNTKGQQFNDPIWRVMAHLVDHGASYRGVLMSGLRLLGRTPPSTGLVTYTRLTAGHFRF